LTTVAERWNQYRSLVAGLVFVALGVVTCARGNYAAGVLALALGAYGSVTFIQERRRGVPDGPKAEEQRP
jgi:hypothetical protein